MHFKVDRDMLNDSVSFVAKLLPQRSSQPILNRIRVQASEGTLTVSSFDYEVSAKATIEAEVFEPFDALIMGRMLGEITALLPQADVEFTKNEEDSFVSLVCGQASFTLGTSNVDEYPELPQFEHVSGSVSAKDFSEIVGQISVSAAKEDVLKELTGVLFEIENNSLTLTATDRYRAGVRTIEWQNSSVTVPMKALVPVKIVSEAGKTFSSADDVKISIVKEDEREMISFSAGNKQITSQLLAGDYPPMRDYYPTELDNYAVVNANELIDSIKRVSVVLEHQPALLFSFTGGSLKIEAVNEETAKASETIDCHLNGEGIEVPLRPTLFLDGLRACHSDFVRICFTRNEDTGAPGRVLVMGQTSREVESDGGFKYLIMPNLLNRKAS